MLAGSSVSPSSSIRQASETVQYRVLLVVLVWVSYALRTVHIPGTRYDKAAMADEPRNFCDLRALRLLFGARTRCQGSHDLLRLDGKRSRDSVSQVLLGKTGSRYEDAAPTVATVAEGPLPQGYGPSTASPSQRQGQEKQARTAQGARVRFCECGLVACPKQGLPGTGKEGARWCSRCPTKPPATVDLLSRRCQCGAHLPSFGLRGEARGAARWCAICPGKPEEAVNLKVGMNPESRCECGKAAIPRFGLRELGSVGRRWCKLCPGKPAEAVNVVDKLCECGASRPTFGLPWAGTKGDKWCSKCPGRPTDAIHKNLRNGPQGPSYKKKPRNSHPRLQVQGSISKEPTDRQMRNL